MSRDRQWKAVGGLVVDQHQNVVAMRYSRKRLLEGGGMVDLMSGDHGGMENAIQPVEADENCRLMADAPRVKREHRRLREAMIDVITIARAQGVARENPLMLKAMDAIDTTA